MRCFVELGEGKDRRRILSFKLQLTRSVKPRLLSWYQHTSSPLSATRPVSSNSLLLNTYTDNDENCQVRLY